MDKLPSTMFFGSCRVKVNNPVNNFYFTRKIAGTHSPLETLELIKYINNKKYKSKYLFSRVELQNINRKRYKGYYDQSEIIVVEICSRKIYQSKNGDISLYEGAKLFNYEIKSNKWDIIILSDEDIEKYIVEIKKYIFPKKLILITHYSYSRAGKTRDDLINTIINICKKYDIPYFNPTYIAQHKSNITNSNHYSKKGVEQYSKDIIKLIKSI